jgi:hypothetical protein
LTAWLPVDSTVCRASGLGWTISNSTAAAFIGTAYRAPDQSVTRGMHLNSATNLYWKTTFTMSAWIKWTGGTGDQNIFNCRYNNGGWEAYYQTASKRFLIFRTGGSSFSYSKDIQNQWYHIALVRSGNWKLYLNGNLVSSGGDSTAIEYNKFGEPDRLSVGNWETLVDGRRVAIFVGSIDDVRYSDFALTASDVKALYYARRPTQ